MFRLNRIALSTLDFAHDLESLQLLAIMR